MSCPYFDPVAPRTHGARAEDSTLPLGDEWAGLCRAEPDRAYEADKAGLRMLCNIGYARGACNRFPATDGPDAARFTLLEDNGTTLRLYYVLERDHPSPPGECTPRQAAAYAHSYLRRKAESRSWKASR
ncbi:MAG: hypothetical protein ABSH56_31530 [Bryobacteraceae bacterium]